jgi:hypothetical protein
MVNFASLEDLNLNKKPAILVTHRDENVIHVTTLASESKVDIPSARLANTRENVLAFFASVLPTAGCSFLRIGSTRKSFRAASLVPLTKSCLMG